MTSKIIVSIPHTGTRFLKERLDIENHIHTHSNWVTLKAKIHNKEIISPLRNPSQVWRSWCRRNKDTALLNWMPHFFAAYYMLHTVDQLYDVDFICIDKREDSRIKDWSKVGDSDGDHAGWKLHKVDLRVLYKLPFVQKHYPSWRAN